MLAMDRCTRAIERVGDSIGGVFRVVIGQGEVWWADLGAPVGYSSKARWQNTAHTRLSAVLSGIDVVLGRPG